MTSLCEVNHLKITYLTCIYIAVGWGFRSVPCWWWWRWRSFGLWLSSLKFKVLLNTDYVFDISMSVEYTQLTPYLWHWLLLSRELIFVKRVVVVIRSYLHPLGVYTVIGKKEV